MLLRLSWVRSGKLLGRRASEGCRELAGIDVAELVHALGADQGLRGLALESVGLMGQDVSGLGALGGCPLGTKVLEADRGVMRLLKLEGGRRLLSLGLVSVGSPLLVLA